MKPFPRSERVGEHILRALSELLRRGLKDPRLRQTVITGVKVTRDLRIARVYFCVTGDRDRIDSAQAGFDSARGYVKRELASCLGLRYMPDIEFHYDDSFDYGERIDHLIRSIQTDHAKDSSTAEDEPVGSDRHPH